MATTAGSTSQHLSSSGDNKRHTGALAALTSLFFMWGFLTCLNDILIPHLKSVFSLNYTQAMLVQFCFFGAYFVVSMPAGALVRRIGFKRGIVLGLLIAGLGCLMFYPAASLRIYGLFLGALFVLAAGITILQVSANPYVTALGPQDTASSRLTMTQAFNSLGTTVAPFFGATLILSAAVLGADQIAALSPTELNAYHAEEAAAVQLPYIGLALALFVLAGVFAWLKLPAITPDATVVQGTEDTIWNHPHLVFGAVGIFLYVGAEVAIGSLLVNYFALPSVAGMEEAKAAEYIAYYWGGAMVGRFIGAAVMQKVSAQKVLAFNAAASVILIATSIATTGTVAMWTILAVGLFNSIMFPTIFALAITGLGRLTSNGSGLLCLAIVGGALVPLLQGMLADGFGLQISFVLPLLCYIYIAFYGLKGSTPR
ncbi:sugar MFS transporter [Simiduia aestuariiviva]|uniref:FHS family L-fucose permease-like MFS transporter n=1 Tax=Simiduia aestuariiviva TaxID=1510459 RepID=A0A839URG5_9GAMM|nr:sugar MFS transporter [Simiduia aestuariiviva]MBB3167997.1 FHS family L-fucose permease-like MFS transporter [Simiduia aestuariiviva]